MTSFEKFLNERERSLFNRDAENLETSKLRFEVPTQTNAQEKLNFQLNDPKRTINHPPGRIPALDPTDPNPTTFKDYVDDISILAGAIGFSAFNAWSLGSEFGFVTAAVMVIGYFAYKQYERFKQSKEIEKPIQEHLKKPGIGMH